MNNSEKTSAPSDRRRLELMDASPWLFFIYWPGIRFRSGNGPRQRAMGCLGISRELSEFLMGQEDTRDLLRRFNARCRRLVLGVTVPTGLLLNLVVFACSVPPLMAHGFLPVNDRVLSLLVRHMDLTAVVATLAVISFGFAAMLSRSVHGSFTQLFDAYNMSVAGIESKRQDSSTSSPAEPVFPHRDVKDHSPGGPARAAQEPGEAVGGRAVQPS